MTDTQTLNITLNPSGVAAPAQRAALISSEVVGTALRALAKDDLSRPDMQGGHWGYQFNGLTMSDDERRETYQNWLLSKGFQDIARGIRETLEEAVLFISLAQRKPCITTLEQFETDIAEIRANAAKPHFPKLLETVNAGLTEPLAFEAEFLSLQKVRNCLEHRGGCVGVRDIDASGSLTLSFPRLRIFYRRGDTEVEVAPGEVIDTHEINDPAHVGKEVPIYISRVTRVRTYALSEPVIISASDFYEIAMACHFFASDLTGKLPTVTVD
ncbi:hypothetical protein [Sphingobium chlorophenolicum]|nr:hypothetical protein [Sphingobium chlorophenolicum]